MASTGVKEREMANNVIYLDKYRVKKQETRNFVNAMMDDGFWIGYDVWLDENGEYEDV